MEWSPLSSGLMIGGDMLLSTHASLLHPTPAHNLVVGRDEVLTLQGTVVVNKITSVWTKLRRGFRHKPHPREVGCHFAPSTTKLLFSKDGGIQAPVGWLTLFNPVSPGCLFSPWGHVVWTLYQTKLDLESTHPFLTNRP